LPPAPARRRRLAAKLHSARPGRRRWPFPVRSALPLARSPCVLFAADGGELAAASNVQATATQGPLARPWGLVPSSTRALGSQVSRLLDGSGLRAPGRCAELAACADPKAAAGGDSAFFSALPKPPACPGCALRCRWRGAHVFSGPRLTTNWLPSPTLCIAGARAVSHKTSRHDCARVMR
jgi:hypothetical protein